ncbi:MAG: leucine-rich repeat domain-containing protein [Acholeplasmatales bacterium]|nr:leucine-rich repeat domain-containing protein [Acholeplasmatales bacterium]
MEISSNVKLFLKNNKETLSQKPKELDWEELYYTAEMELEDYEIGELGTLFRKAHPEFYLDRIPQNFLHSSPIEHFNIPKRHDLEGIYARAFCNSALKEIIIPHNIKKIGASAFESCLNLEKVIFEDGCTTLVKTIFKDCSNLQFIKLPQTIDTIPNGCFWNCKSLRTLQIPKKVEVIKNEAFLGLENCVIDFENNMNLLVEKDAFPFNSDELGIKVSCYYDTPIYDYCEEHNIPFKRLR